MILGQIWRDLDFPQDLLLHLHLQRLCHLTPGHSSILPWIWPPNFTQAIFQKNLASTQGFYDSVCGMRCAQNNRLLNGADHILRRAATIEALPDNVLLDIFEFCLMVQERISGERAKMWNKLLHVCRTWRHIVFQSPLRLDLRLFCTDSTPVKETLDVWPRFPIEIRSDRVELADNIIAALMHPERICDISLYGIRIPLERLASAMQKPFPALEHLALWPDADGEDGPVLPDTFLGGSAPRLRGLTLHRITFPTLPRLLLSSSDLFWLHLHDISPPGYIPPRSMVTYASALTKLEFLIIEFKSPASIPDRTISTPFRPTRAVFSSLTHFQFRGTSEYLEDLVAQFNAPVLEVVNITLFNQPFLGNHWGQLRRLIRYSPIGDRAEIVFTGGEAKIDLLDAFLARFSLRILCPTEVQVSSMAQIFREVWLPLSYVDWLDFQDEGFHEQSTWQVDIDSTAWRDIIREFDAVHTLRISRGLQSPILSVLQRLDEQSAGVLPALQDLYLGGYELSGSNIEPFITERQRSKRPVTVHSWEEP
jgi:hypothetical protein